MRITSRRHGRPSLAEIEGVYRTRFDEYHRVATAVVGNAERAREARPAAASSSGSADRAAPARRSSFTVRARSWPSCRDEQPRRSRRLRIPTASWEAYCSPPAGSRARPAA